MLINEAKVASGDPDGNPWGVSFKLMFMMNTDSHHFRGVQELTEAGSARDGRTWASEQGGDVERMVPLIEGKLIHHFDHRWATFDDGGPTAVPSARDTTPSEKRNPDFSAQPRYWVPESEVQKRLGPGTRQWLLGWRDITNSTNERTLVAAAFPRSGVGNNLPIIASGGTPPLAVTFSSLVLDFCARLKIGGSHLNFFIVNQLPVPSPRLLEHPTPWNVGERIDAWLDTRALELTYTAWDMTPFAEELGDMDASGRANPPFVWDDERRFGLRAELDAAFFHLYGIAREDVDYIMDTFPIVRRKDEAAHGEYRTKRVILEMYDAMQTAIDTGVPYTSPIDPPPGHGPRHPQREDQQ